MQIYDRIMSIIPGSTEHFKKTCPQKSRHCLCIWQLLTLSPCLMVVKGISGYIYSLKYLILILTAGTSFLFFLHCFSERNEEYDFEEHK